MRILWGCIRLRRIRLQELARCSTANCFCKRRSTAMTYGTSGSTLFLRRGATEVALALAVSRRNLTGSPRLRRHFGCKRQRTRLGFIHVRRIPQQLCDARVHFLARITQ